MFSHADFDLCLTPLPNIVKWCFDTNIGSEVRMPTTAHELAFGIVSALAMSFPTNDSEVGFDILVAEDNLVNQKLCTKILEKHNHKVELAGNGLLALDAFKRRVAQDKLYDIILVCILFRCYVK
jgi:osomolarity two-component system sensor histidine kinase NIK1